MLARSEQSGISEPRLDRERRDPSAAHPKALTHQSLLDVSQAILQHRDLDRAVS